MVKLPNMVGSMYTLSSANGQKMLDVKVMPGTKTGCFRFGVENGYLRIFKNGGADAKGGGGEWCNFSVEVHESGLISLERGPFRLGSGDEHNFLTSAAKESPPSADTLWAVEANEKATPQMLHLCQGSLRFGPFLRKDRSDGCVLFQGPDGGCLRILPGNGAVDTKGGGGPPCQFVVDMQGDRVRLQSIAEPRRYLGVSSWGALTGREVESSRQMFYLEATCPEDPIPSPKLTGHTDFDELVDFSPEERMAFIRDGFIIVRNVVPLPIVEAALGQINATLLTPGSVTKDDDGRLQTCNSAQGSDATQALLYATPLWTLAQRLLGRGRVAHCPHAQMALRAPKLGVTPLSEDSIPPKQWHIDGMDKDNHSPFSILLGVALSDQSQPNSGNLVAFQGSHHVLHPLLRREVEAGTWNWRNGEGDDTKPALAGGQQILLKPGDAVLVHQKVAHRVGINVSPHIRYQTYFRLKHVDHAQKVNDGSFLDDLWGEFEGLRDGIAESGDETMGSDEPFTKVRKMDLDD